MNDNPDLSYLFTPSELSVMALSLGYKNIVGFDFSDNDNCQNDMINSLNSMVNRNIYKNKEKYFYLNEPYREIIKLMCTAKEILCIKFKNNILSDMCCYISGKNILVCELTGGNKKVKLTVMSANSLWNLLKESGRLPKPKNTAINSENPDDILSDNIDKLHERISLTPEINITLRIEKYNILTGERADAVTVEKALNNYISYMYSGNIVNYIYSYEKLKEIFYCILELEL